MKPKLTDTLNARRLSLFFLFILLMGCQNTQPTHFAETPIFSSPTDTLPTSTPLRGFTATSTTTPKVTTQVAPASTPTPSATSTLTPTIMWEESLLSLTPLPPLNQGITEENISQLKSLAVWTAGKANDIVLSPDGLTLAVGTNIGAYLYHSQNFQLLDILQTPYSIQSMAFSSDSRRIALAQSGQTIDVYELEGNTFIARLSFSSWNLPSTYQVHVHFSPNDTDLVSVVKTQSEIFVNRWDLNTLQPTTAFNIENPITSFINPDLDLIGTITESNLILQSLTFSEESDTLPLPTDLPLSFWENLARSNGEIIPSTTGNFVLINNGSSITHWQIIKVTVTYRQEDYPPILNNPCLDAPNTCRNLDNGFSWSCANEPNIPPVEIIAMTPDQIMALISLNEGRTEFRRVSDGLLAWEIDAHFTDITLSPGSEFFFGVRPDGTIEKRSTLDGALINKLNQHPNRLYDLDFSPDGAVLAVGYDDGWVRVYSTFNGELLGFLSGSAQSLEFSPDGSLLAAGLSDGTVRIFILEEGRFYDLPGGHLAAVTDLTFSSDGQRLLTGSKDCTASVWDIKDRYRIQSIIPDRDHPFRITTVGYGMDNDFKFITGDNRGITIVKENEIQEINFLEDDEIVTFALEPEQTFLAATGSNTWLLPLTTEDMTSPYPLSPNTHAIGYVLNFTPDGSALIVATKQALTFWSPMNGSFLGSLGINESILSGSQPAALVISPDGTLIALATSNGLINIFAIP